MRACRAYPSFLSLSLVSTYFYSFLARLDVSLLQGYMYLLGIKSAGIHLYTYNETKVSCPRTQPVATLKHGLQNPETE